MYLTWQKILGADPSLGDGSAVQILDDRGIPENPGESEH
jgi:hypothetical protein